MKKLKACALAVMLAAGVSTITSCSESAYSSLETSVSANTSMFADGDVKTVTEDAADATIALSGSSATTTASSGVSIAGGVIKITKAATYLVTGSLDEGYLYIDVGSEEKVILILKDVSITSSNYAPVYLVSADKLTISLEGSSTLTNSGSFVQQDDNTVDGAIFAKDDLTIKGDGSLTIQSSKHGIVAKDDLKIMSGNISITAGGHGIDANDSVRLANPELLKIASTKDGIHVENSDDASLGYFYMEEGTIDITAGYDGIDASNYLTAVSGSLTVNAGGGSSKAASSTSTKGLKATGDMTLGDVTVNISSADDSLHCNGNMVISRGTYTLNSGDDGVHADNQLTIAGATIDVQKSYEGLEATIVDIQSGDIKVNASDDGINAAGGNDSSSTWNFSTDESGQILISGGTIYVNAAGDGLDANGSLAISGGTTFVEGPTDSGNGALDYDTSGTITGGTIVAIGSTGMAMNFSSSTQGSYLKNFTSTFASGSAVTLTDSSGNQIVSYTSSKQFASVLISSPAMTVGQTYTLVTGTTSTSLTLSSLITTSGSSNQPGGGGGQPGGR